MTLGISRFKRFSFLTRFSLISRGYTTLGTVLQHIADTDHFRFSVAIEPPLQLKKVQNEIHRNDLVDEFVILWGCWYTIEPIQLGEFPHLKI